MPQIVEPNAFEASAVVLGREGDTIPVTPLTDTNGDSILDFGWLASTASVNIVVKVTLPLGVR